MSCSTKTTTAGKPQKVSWEPEGSWSRFRTHANDWLRYLANVNEAHTTHPRSRRRLVTPPSECRWITVLVSKVLVSKMNLLTLWPWPLNRKSVPILGYPKIIPNIKFQHLGTFVSYAADKLTDSKILARPTDTVGVDNYCYCCKCNQHKDVTRRMLTVWMQPACFPGFLLHLNIQKNPKKSDSSQTYVQSQIPR